MHKKNEVTSNELASRCIVILNKNNNNNMSLLFNVTVYGVDIILLGQGKVELYFGIHR